MSLVMFLKRRASAYSLALCLSAACALTSASADVARVAVPGAPSVAGAPLAAGATPGAAQVLHINFVLKSNQKAELPAFIASQHDPKSPNFRKWITPTQFGKRFGASDADVQAVAAFARSQGFKITHLWENHLFIAADATVAQAERAFGTSIQGYTRPEAQLGQGETKTFYAPSGPVTLPASVASRIESVIGLDNMLQMHPRFSRRQTSPPVTGPVPIKPPPPPGMKADFSSPMAPSDVSTFYGLDPFHNAGVYGDGQNIAIISPTSYTFQDNLDFGSAYGLSGWTVWWVDVDGGPTDSNGAMEACLDTEIMIGQAPHSTIWVFQFPNNLNDFTDAYNTLASSSYQGSGTANIQVVSQSWGLDEPTMHADGLDSIVAAYDTVLGQLNSEGVAFYNSSGDTGGLQIVPSTDPNVTAVGGTDNLVSNSDNTWNSEQGWNGSGGGNSIYFSLPSWQSGPGVSNGYSDGNRQVPDVAADGGPTPGFSIRTGGSWYQVWGTSAASPLWAVANLLLDQETNNLYGLTQWHSANLNMELYWLGANLNSDVYGSGYNGTMVYRDTLVAESGSPFPCTPAWDYVTGWGSANFYKLWADYVEYWGAPGGSIYDGRYGSISLSDSNGTETQFNNLTTYSINTPYGCSGPADAPQGTLDVNIDGVDNNYTMGRLPVGFMWPNNGIISTAFSLGSHTITQSITLSTPNWSQTTVLSTLTFTVNPGITGLALSPTSVYGGVNSRGTVTLSAPAPTGGAVVSLSSANAHAKVPASVKIAAGKTSGVFNITTTLPAAVLTGAITATYSGTTASQNLTVRPNAIASFTISPNSVIGGNSTTGTVKLGVKTAVAVKITFASNDIAIVPVPAAITIPIGAQTGTVTIKTKATAKKATVTLTATALKSSVQAKLTVNP